MIERINDSSSWRAYEDGELTHSAAHYLTAILHLRQQYGYARLTDVAEFLKISRGAASRAVGLLKDRGWIDEDPHRMLLLTPAGQARASEVERNYLVAASFLEQVLGVPGETAHEDACKMEHLLSPRTIQALTRLMDALQQNKRLMSRIKEQLEAGEPVSPLSGRK